MSNVPRDKFEVFSTLLDSILRFIFENGGKVKVDLLVVEFERLEREIIQQEDSAMPGGFNDEKITLYGLRILLGKELLLMNSLETSAITLRGKMKLMRGGFSKEYSDQLKLIELPQKSFDALSDQLNRADAQIEVLQSQLETSNHQLNALTVMSNNADRSSGKALIYSIIALIVTGIMGIGSIIVGIVGINVSSTEAYQLDQIILSDSLIKEQIKNREQIDTLYRLRTQKEPFNSKK